MSTVDINPYDLGHVEYIDMTWKSDPKYYTALGNEKIQCEVCGKLVGGIRQHRKAVHGYFKKKKAVDLFGVK